MAWKRLRQHKRAKPKQKIKWEQWGLGLSAKEQPTIPMEEIRRQGMMLAGRALGQGVRSRPLVQGVQNTNSNRSAKAIRRVRRGAIQ